MVAIGNIVIETATGVGTGALTLAAFPYYRRFSDVFGTGAGNTFYYCIRHRTVDEYEVGIGYCSAADTLVRSSVIESSNANALVNFSAGDKDCINDIPASLQTINGVPYTGATANVDLGSHSLEAFGLTASPTGNNTAIVANGSGSGVGVDITHAGSGTKLRISDTGSGDLIDAGAFNVDNAGNVTGNNLSGTNTGDQDLSGLVPYTGATANVYLGDKYLMANRGIGINNTVPYPVGSTGTYPISLSPFYHIAAWEGSGFNGNSYIMKFLRTTGISGVLPNASSDGWMEFQTSTASGATRLTYQTNYITYYTGTSYVFTLTTNNAEFTVPVAFYSANNFFTFAPGLGYDDTIGFINTRNIPAGLTQDKVINQVGTGASIGSMSPDPAYWEQTYMIKLFDRGNFIKPIYVAGYTVASGSSGGSV